MHVTTFKQAIIITSEFFVNETELNSGAIYYVLYVTFSALGLVFHGYFYAFHLVHIVRDHDMLNRAIESITRNGVSLLAVTALAITVVYVFSMVAFLFFRVDYDTEEGKYCDSLFQCFATTLTWGLTHGGGLREVLLPGNSQGHPGDYRYIFRIVFDLLFWVCLSIIAMNLVLGIIVDTFSQLRSERERSIEELTNQCFICSLPGHDFGVHFERHIKEEHNMWDYVYYSMQLLDVPESERNYHENYLYRTFIQEQTTIAFPISRALRAVQKNKDQKDTDSKIEMLLTKVESLESQLQQHLKRNEKAAGGV